VPVLPPVSDPVRVVLFCRPPGWEWGIQRFVCLLENHPKIELTGVFCQGLGASWGHRLQDVRSYRGNLAIPIVLLEAARDARRYIFAPGMVRKTTTRLADISRKIHYVPDIHARDVLDNVKSLYPHLGLVYGAPLLKQKLFAIPPLGTLGIHHGKLPEYRGVKTTFWAMYNGEPTVGVTIQRINAGLDSGEVVRRGEVPVGSKSLAMMNRELEDLGLDLFIQAILDVKEGKARFEALTARFKPYRHPGLKSMLAFHARRMGRLLRPSKLKLNP
jgi:folate-dependent phosphoribosylglycinamide formyltransferase PurN